MFSEKLFSESMQFNFKCVIFNHWIIIILLKANYGKYDKAHQFKWNVISGDLIRCDYAKLFVIVQMYMIHTIIYSGYFFAGSSSTVLWAWVERCHALDQPMTSTGKIMISAAVK